MIRTFDILPDPGINVRNRTHALSGGDLLAESLDMVHKREIKVLVPHNPNPWSVLEYDSDEDLLEDLLDGVDYQL